jgi:ABC-2 type transport system ATP-binding protein
MIDVEQLRKSFDGTRALDGFTLHVGKGELFGLVGPNGAGKTTLMKVLSTLLPMDSGTAEIGGLEVKTHARDVKRMIGYLPDQPGVYQDMSVREFLEFFADAFHVTGARQRAAVDRALERSGLADRSGNSVEQLSFGMKQRLVLAKTLLHDPKVLLLDEPATGLDPLARIELREQLRQLQTEGMTILISSHILSDLEDICTQIALIGAGRNATDADGHSILQLRTPQAPGRIYEIGVLGDSIPAAAIVNSVAGARTLESSAGRLVVEIKGADEQAAALLRTLVVGGVNILRFDHRALDLEERYRMVFRERRP